MKKKLFFIIGFLMPFHFVFSQHSATKGLAIGDVINDIEFLNILNSKAKTGKLSEYKNKLVILDLWSTYCSSCIAGFPKMEKLQQQFDTSIQILFVNPYKHLDSEKRIIETLENNKKRIGFYPSLPIPIHDTQLITMFPHKSIPHQVWIAPGGKIIAVTSSVEVTYDNIKAALSGKAASIPVKDDWKYENEQKLDAKTATDIQYRSLFSSYRGGIGFESSVNTNEKGEITGWYMLNLSLRGFINGAYDDILKNFADNRIIVESEKPSIYSRENLPENLRCYEIKLPAGNVEKASQVKAISHYLKQDLERTYNVSVRVEKRKLSCYILVGLKNEGLHKSKFQKQAMDIENSTKNKYMRKFSIYEIVDMMNQYLDNPLLNKVESDELIDIEFPTPFEISDSPSIIRVLEDNGFIITQSIQDVNVAIISDRQLPAY